MPAPRDPVREGGDEEGLFFLFDDLSRTFFNGELRRDVNVYLAWEDGEPGSALETFGCVTAAGVTMANGRKNAMTRISLNRDLVNDVEVAGGSGGGGGGGASREGRALAALLHGMVHAHFMNRCGRALDGSNVHDEFFRAALHAISRVFDFGNEEISTLVLLSAGPKCALVNGRMASHCEWTHPLDKPLKEFDRTELLDPFHAAQIAVLDSIPDGLRTVRRMIDEEAERTGSTNFRHDML
ncbi:hypothetical protein KEM52_003499 [Ascosphaera acerosa]|nr:hypothetical protein KEM52_003499 [Ascosphaera acerosa]